MSDLKRQVALFSLLGLGVIGCNSSTDSAHQEEKVASISKSIADLPVDQTESGTEPVDSSADEEPIELTPPKPGTPEWFLQEITTLRMSPIPETDDLEELRQTRRERNEKIIDMATKTIGLTHSNPNQEPQFTLAVHHLVDTRRQLALQGDRESIDALYEYSETLYKRDPKSRAASEAAYVLTQFAHDNAKRFAAQEPRWLEEFARQARKFAANFSAEDGSRAVSMLFAAARSCDLYGLNDTAIDCYSQLFRQFPDTPHGMQAQASLRRLQLLGQPLQLAGPTMDGGFAAIDDYRGKVVLVVFWSTQAASFVSEADRLIATAKSFSEQDFAILAVNLDDNEAAVDAFLEQHPLDCPQIFHPEPERRGWENPVASYYGVRSVPVYWLVDRDGTVTETRLDVDDFESRVRQLLNR